MAIRDLSILIVDENSIRASIIVDGLREAGHHRVAVIQDVNDLARSIETVMPDVFIIDLENPKRDTLEHFFSLTRTVRRPIAMFVDRTDDAMMEEAVKAGVSAYVVDGLKKERVKAIMDVAILRFNAFSRLTQELERARSQLEDRRIIEQAKGILMKTRAISEAAAHDLLRKSAMNQNRRMVDIAQSVVTAADLLGP